MPVQPYINFGGNCREAVEFYADVFGSGQPNFMTFSQMPSEPNFPIPDEAKNLIMHTYFTVAGTRVMASDVFPGMELSVGNNVSLTVVSTDREVIQNGFDRLSQGGTVHMPLQQTFWSQLYGNLKDRFGVEWQFSLDSGEGF